MLKKSRKKIILKKKPEILDIYRLEDIKKTVKIAAKKLPIVFSCLGVYGLGGLPEAFTKSHKQIPSISKMKDNRDFYKHPPVALPSWQKLMNVVDWTKISHEKITQFMERLYSGLPIHVILPIEPSYKKILPFAKDDGRGGLSHAFMCSGAYSPLQTLIQLFEEKTKGILMATSANPRGVESYATADMVAKSFPQLPVILTDKKFDQLSETTNWVSHTMYDLTNFPTKLRLVRRGSVNHELFVLIVNEMELQIEIDITEVKVLTEQPPIDSVKKLQEILTG